MQTLSDRVDCAGSVLAVDDCAAMREILRASLAFQGYSVQVADSGWAALQAVREFSFDAVVLDVEMPGLDGMAVGRALRRDPRTASSVIAMHSSVDEAAVCAGFSGYDIFVPKGASPLALGERMNELLRRRRTAADPAEGDGVR